MDRLTKAQRSGTCQEFEGLTRPPKFLCVHFFIDWDTVFVCTARHFRASPTLFYRSARPSYWFMGASGIDMDANIQRLQKATRASGEQNLGGILIATQSYASCCTEPDGAY